MIRVLDTYIHPLSSFIDNPNNTNQKQAVKHTACFYLTIAPGKLPGGTRNILLTAASSQT